MTIEERVSEYLNVEDGADVGQLAMCTGFTRAQVSGALQRLKAKGIARGGYRWRETAVWYFVEPGEAEPPVIDWANL